AMSGTRFVALLADSQAEIGKRDAHIGTGIVPERGQRALVVIVEDQAARGFFRLVRVAGNTASLEDRANVAVILDILDGFLVTQSRRIGCVPLLAGFVLGLGRQQRRAVREIEDLVIGPGGIGLLEGRRQLAVGVAAAAVGANLARTKLMPRL